MAKTGITTSAVCALLLAATPTLAAEMDFDGAQFPCISYNISQAISDGKPTTLTRITGKQTIEKHRRQSCRRAKKIVKRLNQAGAAGTPASCDEYPFASSAEGGTGAHVTIVPVTEADIQGGFISKFYNENGIVDGSTYTVKTSNLRVIGPNPGELAIVTHGKTEQCYVR